MNYSKYFGRHFNMLALLNSGHSTKTATGPLQRYAGKPNSKS